MEGISLPFSKMGHRLTLIYKNDRKFKQKGTLMTEFDSEQLTRYQSVGYSVVSTFLPFTAGLPSSANVTIAEMVKNGLRAIANFGIWYSFLSVSKRVRGTYADECSFEGGSSMWQ